jgi:uncharacterized protein YmfQ (DUF2313 family)
MGKRSASDYRNLLLSLLPKGKLWTRILGSRISEFFLGLGGELARLNARGADLLSERDTLTSTELLGEHEYDLGLPDECSTDTLTTQERQQAANVKLTLRGQLTPQHYIDVAARYGYTATVVEFGEGDPEVDSIFKWKFIIQASRADIVLFRAGLGRAGEPLQKFPELLNAAACYAQVYKPAHTFLIVDLEGAAFSRAFNIAFDSLSSSSIDYLQGAFNRDFNADFDVKYGGAFTFREFNDDFDKPQ